MSEPIDIKAVRAVCDAATTGPWESLGAPSNTGSVLIYCETGFPVANTSIVWNRPLELLLADAEFIALARTALPRALDELEQSRAECERLGDEGKSGWWGRACARLQIELNQVTAERDSLRAQLAETSKALCAEDQENDHLRAQIEQVTAERDAWKESTEGYREGRFVSYVAQERVERDTVERIAAWLEQTAAEDDSDETGHRYWYQAAIAIRSGAYRLRPGDGG